MNDRIRELMEQAMEPVDPYALEGEFGPHQLNEEKFAELIVQDAIEVHRLAKEYNIEYDFAGMMNRRFGFDS